MENNDSKSFKVWWKKREKKDKIDFDIKLHDNVCILGFR